VSRLVGSEMCIRDRYITDGTDAKYLGRKV
jgi:hypothetical protein